MGTSWGGRCQSQKTKNEKEKKYYEKSENRENIGFST